MRTISIDDGAYNFLKVMRLTFGTYAKALMALIKEHQQQKKDIAKLKRELKQKDKLLQKTLLIAVSSKPTIVNVNNLTPPPPVSSMKNAFLEYVPPPETENAKLDLQKELLSIFTGEVLKPSEVLTTTKPKFIDHPLKELRKDCTIPSIKAISIKNRNVSIKDYAPKQSLCKI